VRDELVADGVVSTGKASDVEFGERDEDVDVTAGDCSAWEWSDDDPLAETVRVSLAMTAFGGDGFMATDIEPRIRCTSGCEVDRSLEGVVVPDRGWIWGGAIATVDDSNERRGVGEGARPSIELVDRREVVGLSELFRRCRSIHPSPSTSLSPAPDIVPFKAAGAAIPASLASLSIEAC
jgi:hypothetical protein